MKLLRFPAIYGIRSRASDYNNCLQELRCQVSHYLKNQFNQNAPAAKIVSRRLDTKTVFQDFLRKLCFSRSANSDRIDERQALIKKQVPLDCHRNRFEQWLDSLSCNFTFRMRPDAWVFHLIKQLPLKHRCMKRCWQTTYKWPRMHRKNIL